MSDSLGLSDASSYLTDEERQALAYAQACARCYRGQRTSDPLAWDVVELSGHVWRLTEHVAHLRRALRAVTGIIDATEHTTRRPSAPPRLTVASGSSVYMCGHHEVVVRRVGLAGSIGLTSHISEAERLIDTLNRWYGAPDDPVTPLPEPCD